jgi:hypothetical protein
LFDHIFYDHALSTINYQHFISVIFGFYAYESLPFVNKSEMDRLVLATEGQVPAALSELFLDVSTGTSVYTSWLFPL